VELAAEIADGWLPIFFAPQRYAAYFQAQVDAGFAKAGNGKRIENFDIAPSVTVVLEDNLEMAYNQVRPQLALYIGGMGAKGKNFYNDLAVRYGFEEAAAKIQDLYLAGNKGEAMAAVPNELIDAVALVGSRDRIKDRVQIWLDSDITTLNIMTFDIEAVRTMAEILL
jgi:alkanesulfonate monooxygenase SsuD/methylene tetrahydromethanopterin reductase-like flavin-dependent oxidoreductase (luciferase family)